MSFTARSNRLKTSSVTALPRPTPQLGGRSQFRRRLVVMAEFFEHVLHLPLGFHTGVHSGRLLKTMLDGSGGMSSVWLSFFREHCASFVSLFVLLPATMFLNWRLGALLVVLVFVFGAITAYVFH